jgi:glucose-1-phosphate thymidylyltransferase
MKGLVLSGGFGTRLRPLTYSRQKQLIPVANKPILFYALEDLIEAGVKEIGIIVGPNKEQVMDTVKKVDWDAEIHFIEQEEPLGIAHAIKISEEFLGDDPFVMYLGDNILKEGIVEHVKEFENSDYDGSILLTRVENPQEFGIAVLNKDKDIVRIVEKPEDPPTDLAVIGVYMFRSRIFDAVKGISFSKRNQLEITDSIQWLIDHDCKVKSALVKNWWKDTGKPEDILHANRLIIDTIIPHNEGYDV